MASRLTTRAKLLVPVLPLVVGLAIGTLLATATLSWGNAFIIWQLLWWSIVSIVIGLVTVRVAPMILLAVPSNPSDEDMRRLFGIVRLSYAGGALALLAGLATSFWTMVAGSVATAPVELYWPLPIAAFVFAMCVPAGSKLDEIEDQQRRAEIESQRAYKEGQRKKRCSELSLKQRAEYDAKFLMALYSLVRNDRTKQVTLLQVTDKLKHECSPELKSAALQTWRKRKFIAEDHLGLTLAGYYIGVRAEELGMEEALRRHDACLRQSDQYRVAYQKQLFVDIAGFVLPANEQTIGWDDPFSYSARFPEPKSVSMDSLQAVQKDPCWPDLFDAALEALRELGLITVITNKEPPRRSSAFGILGGFQLDNKPDRGPEVRFTAKGLAVYADLGPRDSVELAVNRYEEHQRLEHERLQRCREITGLQRKEFEEQFLLTLYEVVLGDVRPVELRDVWLRLNHECTRELTGHALQIWRELKCINIESRYIEDGADIKIRVSERMDLSLTALGRELCLLAQDLGSMPQARRELLEGSRVKKEYNIMGDVFNDIGAGAMIVNRSNLINAMNATKDTAGPDVSEALRQLAEFIQKSGNNEAADSFNAFTEELQRPNPRKSVLKSLWNGMLAALPTIANLAAVAGTIAVLIT